ncbi:MAG: hypothetical protein EXX96DRAFT_577503 [Benjaminiella poitrasii]|nr:MAG: hypothetical protein EXX96DRAFT_577503 [Benjaminiella poitrasii]
MYPNRIASILQCVRLFTLITAVIIVFGSLGVYSSNSIPLQIATTVAEDFSTAKTWIIQTVSDRRLISTLVASQASIFCPLFILLSPINSAAQQISLIELVCQFLMPFGLALSWMFSILFDLKSTDVATFGDLCLSQENCGLFIFVYGLKFVIMGLLMIETCLVLIQLVLAITTDNNDNRIQLPLDDTTNSNEK